MHKKTIAKTLLFTTALSSMLISHQQIAFSRTLSQTCELGQTCPIPGSDNGQTVFRLKAANGMHYSCEVTSDKESLKFAVTGGKDFSLTEGHGLYNANPKSTIKVAGRFANPNDPNDEGEIKFTKLPFSSDGKVKCEAAKS